MSLYPVRYWSESKKREYDIEEMADPHLLNAERLLARGATDDKPSALLEALRSEILRRGIERKVIAWAKSRGVGS